MLPTLYTDVAEPFSLQQFSELFSKMERFAFRLEMLEFFTIPDEASFFARYRRGEKQPPEGFNNDWVKTIRAAVERGVDFSRVRLVREPIHEYLKFEIAWGYRVNVPAGEKTFVISFDLLPFKTEVPILKDFWLFDESVCFLMEYDFIGRFLGVSKVKSKFIDPYVKLRKELLQRSLPIQKSPLWKFAT